MFRWKLVQLGLDDHYKRLNEVRGKDRMPHTQVKLLEEKREKEKIIFSKMSGFLVCGGSSALGQSHLSEWSALLYKVCTIKEKTSEIFS